MKKFNKSVLNSLGFGVNFNPKKGKQVYARNSIGLQLLPRPYSLVIEFRIIPTRQLGYFGTVLP